ncbi:isochorismatase family protein [Ideonella azotifigens]|uniref:Cysteine hydrolase n=2 Tax=Ideonella azotifigens TaxID=513160 RepID=A0ABN1KGE1_9BURK|nr:isochorismatase family protein [Ideonella azotifigens]
MKTALLVIDVQCGLFDDSPRPFEADAVVDRINALTAQARTAGVPVVFIQHERASGSLAHGSDGWQLERRLKTDARDTFIRKTTPDSFLRTELQETLQGWGVKQLAICGYATEFCVDTTTRRAAALGFPVLLVADAHTTHDKAHASAAAIRAHHNATLPDIASFGPEIRAVNAADLRFGDGTASPAPGAKPVTPAGPPEGLPVYRLLTGVDDAAFCHRVSAALSLGYRLRSAPSATFNGEHVVVAQAVVWPGPLTADADAKAGTAADAATR